MAGDIKQPISKIIASVVAKIKTKVELKFKTTFSRKWNGKMYEVQKVVDSEVLRLSDKYIPFRTGTLRNSGIIGTVIGSGKVSWITPYARQQYYRGRRPGTPQADAKPGNPLKQKSALKQGSALKGKGKVISRGGDSLRGRYWFHRMKEVHGKEIIKAAKTKVSEGESGGKKSGGQSSGGG